MYLCERSFIQLKSDDWTDCVLSRHFRMVTRHDLTVTIAAQKNKTTGMRVASEWVRVIYVPFLYAVCEIEVNCPHRGSLVKGFWNNQQMPNMFNSSLLNLMPHYNKGNVTKRQHLKRDHSPTVQNKIDPGGIKMVLWVERDLESKST